MPFKILFSCLLFSASINAQELMCFTVDSGNYERMDCPISVPLYNEEFDMTTDEFQLIEIEGNTKKIHPSQTDKITGQLWFILEGYTPKQTARKFVLTKKSTNNHTNSIVLQKGKGVMKFKSNDRPILNYQFGMVFPPEGVDKKYRKSGFIHPVWSPGGEVLTRIQPPDHYHHYGIWGPWTKTHIGERQVDFWNLGDGQGTVLFKKFLDQTEGDIFSSFTALQEHVDLGAAKIENQIALNEALEVKVWNIKSSDNSWLVDYTTTIESPLKNGILFDAYRYGGGIGFRATEKWHKDNTSVLTSENKDRLTADGSSAKWAIIEGASNTREGRSGILFMGFPENRQFPEPMRVWPIDGNGGRGDMFFEFCPIRHVEWKIESNKAYQLKYRMLVFDGALSAEEAEIYWQSFANPPTIIVEPKN